MKNKIVWKNVWPVLLILGFLILMVINRIDYVLTATANVPIMDYWRYICQFVDKVFNEGVTLADLWIPQEGATHRAMGMSIFCFLLNVKLFGLNTQIEIVGGVIAFAVNCLFLLWVFLKRMKWENGVEKCGFLLMMICVFNINQWEIMILEFSLGFALRILLILLAVYFFDSLQKENTKIPAIAICTVWMFMVACLTGSYGPAVIGALFFVAIVQLIVNKNNRWKNGIQNLVMISGFAIGTLLFLGGIGGGVSQGAGTRFTDMIMDGRIIKAVFYMLGSSVLHSTSTPVLENFDIFLSVGVVLFVLYMLAIFLFFKRKMYEKTYMPIMLMAYTACSILTISFGRIPMFGVTYTTSSRYVCETTLGLIGLIWIIWYEMCYQFKKLMQQQKVTKAMSFVKLSVCFAGVLFILHQFDISNETEMATAPYRKIYQENLIEKMESGKELSDGDIAMFQSERKYVEEGIEIMKKYKLGVFGE